MIYSLSLTPLQQQDLNSSNYFESVMVPKQPKKVPSQEKVIKI
jgi:hypothetical protein